MNFYDRYIGYIKNSISINVITPPLPLNEDKRCSVCLEDSTYDYFVTPCCGKVYHKKCIIEWLCKNDTCPTCRHQLIDDVNRKFATTSTYIPITKEMNNYRFALWMFGANRVDTIDHDKLIDVINNYSSFPSRNEDGTPKMGEFNRPTNYLQKLTFKDIFNYLFFGQHLINKSLKTIIRERFLMFEKLINLIPIIILFLSSSDSSFSKWWIIFVTSLYILNYNMRYMSSHDIRSLMYFNFSNSSIGWIYYFSLLMFQFFIVGPSAIFINDHTVRSISQKLYIYYILISFFDILIFSSNICNAIRLYIKSEFFSDELFNDDNLFTYFDRHVLSNTISLESNFNSMREYIVNNSEIISLLARNATSYISQLNVNQSENTQVNVTQSEVQLTSNQADQSDTLNVTNNLPKPKITELIIDNPIQKINYKNMSFDIDYLNELIVQAENEETDLFKKFMKIEINESNEEETKAVEKEECLMTEKDDGEIDKEEKKQEEEEFIILSEKDDEKIKKDENEEKEEKEEKADENLNPEYAVCVPLYISNSELFKSYNNGIINNTWY